MSVRKFQKLSFPEGKISLRRDFVLYKLRASQRSNNFTLHLFINLFNRYLLSAVCYVIHRRYASYIHGALVLVGKLKMKACKTKPANMRYL